MKIEKGIPLPVGRKNGPKSEEFHEFLAFCKMASIGDSVLVKNDASNYRLAMLIAQVWLKKTFTASPGNSGTRVWRVK